MHLKLCNARKSLWVNKKNKRRKIRCNFSWKAFCGHCLRLVKKSLTLLINNLVRFLAHKRAVKISHKIFRKIF